MVCVCSLFTYDLYIVFLETQVYILQYYYIYLVPHKQEEGGRVCTYVQCIVLICIYISIVAMFIFIGCATHLAETMS